MTRKLILLLTLIPAAAFAQSYDLSWTKIAGGGGTSTGGTITLRATIGQPDAQPPPVMSGGAFTLTGGFWPGAASTACTMPGDMNGDGHVDGDDIALFINCAITGAGSCGCADFDGGGISATDLTEFVHSLLGL